VHEYRGRDLRAYLGAGLDMILAENCVSLQVQGKEESLGAVEGMGRWISHVEEKEESLGKRRKFRGS
jgi:hypothetical protein